jgi:hypothetical protein
MTDQHSLIHTQSGQHESGSWSSSSGDSEEVKLDGDQLKNTEKQQEEGECNNEMDLDGEQLGKMSGTHQSKLACNKVNRIFF